MAKAPRNLKALKRTGLITIHDGPAEGPDAAPAIDFRLRKRGALRVIDDIAQIPLLGEGIEHLVTGSLAGFKKSGLSAGNKEELQAAGNAIMEAVRNAANDANTPVGKAIRDLIVGLPRLIEDTIVEDTVLEDGEDPEDLRDLVRSFGQTALVNLGIGWVEFNMPEYRDFLVHKMVQGLSAARRQARGTSSSSMPEVAPAASSEAAPTAPDKAEDSLAA